MYTLSPEKKLAVISALVEGNSIRSINRMTDVDRNTIASLLLRTGDRCAEIMDATMRNLRCQYVQADEIWCYVGKKDRHIHKGDSPETLSQWVFVAMDAETKMRASEAHPAGPFFFLKRSAEKNCRDASKEDASTIR